MFLCACCREDIDGIPNVLEGDDLCTSCLHDFFERSITTETNWPPSWAGKRQDPQAYAHVLGSPFIKAYKKKALEWDTPEKDRIYCRQTDPPRRPQECGTFLGRLIDRQKCQQCRACKWYTCLQCLECFSSSDVEGKTAAIEHECDPSIAEQLRERAFAGLKRGWHYQDCPNPQCQKRIELAEACRHIVCFCGTEFCYLCGRKAARRSGHWDRARGSKCPLYPNGLFADDDEDSEPDEYVDPAEEAHEQWQLEVMYEQGARDGGGRSHDRPVAWQHDETEIPHHRRGERNRYLGSAWERRPRGMDWPPRRRRLPERPVDNPALQNHTAPSESQHRPDSRVPRSESVINRRCGTPQANQQRHQYSGSESERLRECSMPAGRSDNGEEDLSTNSSNIAQAPRPGQPPTMRRTPVHPQRTKLSRVGHALSAIIPRVIPRQPEDYDE